MKKYGFTLIELLVVVLIVGILASVAAAQYQKAVEKSRMVQAWTLGRYLINAEEVYYLANGTYAKDWETLGELRPDLKDFVVLLDTTQFNIKFVHKNLPLELRFFGKESTDTPYPGKIVCVAQQDSSLALNLCKSLSGQKGAQYAHMANYQAFEVN